MRLAQRAAKKSYVAHKRKGAEAPATLPADDALATLPADDDGRRIGDANAGSPDMHAGSTNSDEAAEAGSGSWLDALVDGAMGQLHPVMQALAGQVRPGTTLRRTTARAVTAAAPARLQIHEQRRATLERRWQQQQEQQQRAAASEASEAARLAAQSTAQLQKAEQAVEELRQTLAQLRSEHAAQATQVQALEQERDLALGRLEMAEGQRVTLEGMMSRKIAELGAKNAELLRMDTQMKKLHAASSSSRAPDSSLTLL